MEDVKEVPAIPEVSTEAEDKAMPPPEAATKTPQLSLYKKKKPRRKESKARKLNRENVTKLSKQGLTPSQIAKIEGVQPSTVWRYLQKNDISSNALAWYKEHQADLLSKLQAVSQDKRLALLETMTQESIIQMSEMEKQRWYHTLGVIAAVDFDKERLSRGESTQNIDIRTAVVDLQRQLCRLKDGESVVKTEGYDTRAADTQSDAQNLQGVKEQSTKGGGGEERRDG